MRVNRNTTITNIMWKTEDFGYVDHTRDEWLTVYSEAFGHKKEQLFKYDQLKEMTSGCETLDEVKGVAW
ncbi:hypothetical protein [Salipaludibacillus sp. CF4.18]|uniref:DUF4376 domain-containing protein n=1 Tax=Salipaludibacillus sp. CF4.18 TaxID=3373081 RepID=UPI003EE48A5F